MIFVQYVLYVRFILLSFYHLNNIRLAKQTEHIFKVQFSPDSCGLLILGTKYFPQQPVLMQLQSMLFSPYERGSTKPTKIGKVKVKQSRYTPGVAQRVPGKAVPLQVWSGP